MIFCTNGIALSSGYAVNGVSTTVCSVDGTPTDAGLYSLYNVNKDLYFFRGSPEKSDKHIVGNDGKPIELRGIGTHAPLQYSNLHSYEMFESLQRMGINLIRISVYLEDYSFLNSDSIKAYGYLSKPEETKKEIEKIVNYCEQLGMYVLIDWHVYSWGAGSGTGIFHQDEATEFFTYFCNLYKDKSFVMWEIANEPHHQTIEEYLPFIKTMHALIHGIIDNPIVITGTCKDDTLTLWQTLKDNGMEDIFISPHAYGTSIDVDRYKSLWDADFPLFNTEWGNAQSSGDGDREDARATALMKYYHNEKIPQSVWKLTDQNMTTAVLKNQGSINSEYYINGFVESDLSPAGMLYFTWFKYFATKGHDRIV